MIVGTHLINQASFIGIVFLLDIDLTVRGVALRPTTTDGQNFVLQTIRNSHIEPLQNKFVQKINFHYHKASPPPRSKNLCGV